MHVLFIFIVAFKFALYVLILIQLILKLNYLQELALTIVCMYVYKQIRYKDKYET